jgi:hypothetical protein
VWITPLTVAYRAEDVKKEKPRLCRDLTRSSSINAVLPPWHFEYVLATSICVKVQTVWLWTKTDLLKYFTQKFGYQVITTTQKDNHTQTVVCSACFVGGRVWGLRSPGLSGLCCGLAPVCVGGGRWSEIGWAGYWRVLVY